MRAGRHTSEAQTALWAKNRDGEWINVDQAVQANEVVIMLGEEAQKLSFAQTAALYAAEHAVRVEPQGDYIPHSHFNRDPQTPEHDNRVSAAFILRHESAE